MRLAVTMGDAAGVGPEILLRSYKQELSGEDFIAVGDINVLQACNAELGLDVPMHVIEKNQSISTVQGKLNVLNMDLIPKDFARGTVSEANGRAAYGYIEKATNMTLMGEAAAVVTLPVNKEAVCLSHPGFTGHTEMIAELCGQNDYTMMLASDRMVVTHVSTHVSMEQAVKAVTAQRVYDVSVMTHKALSSYIPRPRIAVAGLNAHAGEHGLFGREEIDQIAPAVERCKAEGMEVTGPISPDTVFFRAYRGEFDAVVCMYHDQGHIPMKIIDFDGAVNVTLGLKIIRTSVDHGTAFDIAYKGIASTRSFMQAVCFARKLLGD